MKTFLKNLLLGALSFCFIAVLFGGGYFVGKRVDGDSSIPTNIINPSSDRTEEKIDFSAFWKVWNIVNEKFVPTTATSSKFVSDQEKVYGAISGLVESLNDPYTVFLPPDDNEKFESNIQGNFQGVGMEVGIQDDVLTVISPIKKTPAEKAGVKAGDRILKIDDVSAQSLSLDDAIDKIRGPIGTTVKLTIDRDGLAEPIKISIVRDVINIPTLETKKLDNGIFVISLYNFSANSSNDFRNALREFIVSKKSKLILDLRGNPGGFLESSIDIASWFLPAGKMVVKEDFGNGEEKVFRSKGYNVFNDNLKMVVLVDKGSASASEILAGALQQHDVATLIGENTFGKGSVQELIEITPDTSLKVTIARWLTPNGTSISLGGLTPDFVIENEYKDGKLVEDKQMEEAVKKLLEK